ncbi:hypothetical protein AB0O08_11890 [Streptomyces anulatus]|uniref:hypothetical protein n=1 Tax=Streptomyces anulatus TaxID=1892 RepID=UPI003418061D
MTAVLLVAALVILTTATLTGHIANPRHAQRRRAARTAEQQARAGTADQDAAALAAAAIRDGWTDPTKEQSR